MGIASADRATERRGDSPLRWWVLILAALAVSSSYYESDIIGPIADLLHRNLGYSQSQLGTLNGVINVPSVVIALINGVLMDRYGPARIALWSAAIGMLGASLTAGAPSYEVMVAGRFVFGASEGTIFIALIAALARWFPPSGIALATAVYLSLARVGSYAVDTSPSWARPLYDGGWRPPLWLGLALTVAGFIAVLLLYGLDRRYLPAPRRESSFAEPRMKLSDLVKFDRSYWYILALHVLYATVFFPFRTTYAIEYLQHAKGLTLQAAGFANSWVFFAAIFATPLFGLLADRVGHRALLLLVGTALLPVTFLVLGATDQPIWVSTALMGVSFAMVPAIIWPATTLIVESRCLGTGLGLITVVQALGIFASNRIAGFVSDRVHAGAENPAGYADMLWYFGLLGLVALASAALLWRREKGPRGHGLERARRSTAAKPSELGTIVAPRSREADDELSKSS